MEYGKMPACTCGNPKPKYYGCTDCGRPYCEECAEVVDGELVCTACRNKRVPIHTKDADCTVDPETNCCTVCGVEHATPCLDCGGRGFHRDRCLLQRPEPTVKDLSWFYRWLDHKGAK